MTSRVVTIALLAARRLRASCQRSTQAAYASGLGTLLLSATAYAQETTRPFAAPSQMSTATPSGVTSLGQVTLALGLVLAVIFAAAWVLRRVKGFGRNATGALDIVADLPLGQKERAVLVRVGNQQLLLGVAPGRVTTLHVLTEPVNVTPPTSGSGVPGSTAEKPNFKTLLMKSLGK